MADIFISYSRKDSAKALDLTERLRARGMTVWIDQHSIEGATSWSQEIVEEIDTCGAFLLLVSPDSVVSRNVVRETTLAFESQRTILPVDIEMVPLPHALRYPLAGIQRVAYDQLDSIHRALTRLSLPRVVGTPPSAQPETEGAPHGVPTSRDLRKTLIVLPFEDLSPGNDNGWFADGLTGELIDALSHIKALRLTDRKTSLDFKGVRGKTRDIAKEYNIRYFIEGSVRKFGDQIKISVSLLDSKEGEYLWQDSHKGVFGDIFDIQESVTQKVVDGLKLHLTPDETKKVVDHGTENAEAYELFIRGQEYFNRQTREAWTHAVQLMTDAIRLDSNYANAYRSKANFLASMYRTYDRDAKLLVEGEELVRKAFELQPDNWGSYHPLSHILQLQGRLEEAESTSKLYIEKAPDEYMSHFSLGFFYFSTGQWEKAIAPYEDAVRLFPGHRIGYWNLVVACAAAGQAEKKAYHATRALPYFERHVKLHPDDESMRVSLAYLLHDAGRDDEAREAAAKLTNIKDGTSLFNVACLSVELVDIDTAFKTFRRSIEAGYKNLNSLKTWFEEDGLAPYRNTAEYAEVQALYAKLQSDLEVQA